MRAPPRTMHVNAPTRCGIDLQCAEAGVHAEIAGASRLATLEGAF
jgi:hypothetical protein